MSKRFHPPTTSHNYGPKLARLAEEVLRSGGAHVAYVRHDVWCHSKHGRFCNCDPDVSLRKPKP